MERLTSEPPEWIVNTLMGEGGESKVEGSLEMEKPKDPAGYEGNFEPAEGQPKGTPESKPKG